MIRNLLKRSVDEAFSAAALIATGVVTVAPPQRYVRTLRGLYAYGPLGLMIGAGAQLHGDSAAIVDEQGSCTFAELDERSNALANAWLAAGFEPGQSVGILCRNHRWLFEAVLAAAKVGAHTLLLNTDFSGPQLRDVCAREAVVLLVHDEEFTATIEGFGPALGRYLAWTDTPPSTPTLDDVIAGGEPSAPPRPGIHQRLVLLTSGTTGVPKGAPRDLGTSLIAPGGFLSKIPFRAGRTAFVAAPAFHSWGLLSAAMALAVGDTVIVRRRFDPAATLDAVAEHRCDVLTMVPVMLSRLLALGEEELWLRDTSSLRIIVLAGSPLAPELAVRARHTFGDVLYNVYGSTEVSFATVATPDDLREAPGCVGRPPVGVTVKLFDEHGVPVPRGEVGRIFVGNSFQFAGYTGGGSKEVVEGLMSSGDLGHFDKHGRLFIDGRDDDMIVSGGENVFPREVEELLESHDDVVEAAVIGVDDPDFGQRLRAYVVRADVAELDEDGVRDFVKANLARYKVPRDVVFVDSLPRNPTGKVLKRELA
ncbi:MAG TPA: acyl-CoA synthetase [Jatrophihabitantaceae bacterium]